MIRGIAASKGYAIGRIFIKHDVKLEIDRSIQDNVEGELKRLEEAVEKSSLQLHAIRKQTAEEIGEEEARVFDSHHMFLEDPELIGAAQNAIRSEKIRAEAAIDEVVAMFVGIFESMDNDYMKERAADIKDVGARLIRNLLGIEDDVEAMHKNTIVVAHDLTPSDTAQLDKSKVIAFLTDIGGVTSHSAIMARSLEIPAIVGIQNVTETVQNEMRVIVDGIKGEVILDPSPETIAEYEALARVYQEEREALKIYKDMKLTYASGREALVVGNIGSVEDLDLVLQNGGEGVGLFRTEFVFMNRDMIPTEDEQFEIYKAVAEKCGSKPVVIRTLDIGGDKKIPYLPMAAEENPFLGLRAIRLCFHFPEVFKSQLRALLRASAFGAVHIMFPMIGALSEFRQAKEMLKGCKRELEEAGIPFNSDVPVGIMIEIPSAAVSAKEFAKEVDFFSIGTNDLIQYTLAIDRMNQSVSHLYDPMNPAVLALIEMTIDAAHSQGIWCGMCGEMASDLRATETLAKMELDEFSVSGSAILDVRKKIKESL